MFNYNNADDKIQMTIRDNCTEKEQTTLAIERSQSQMPASITFGKSVRIIYH